MGKTEVFVVASLKDERYYSLLCLPSVGFRVEGRARATRQGTYIYERCRKPRIMYDTMLHRSAPPPPMMLDPPSCLLSHRYVTSCCNCSILPRTSTPLFRFATTGFAAAPAGAGAAGPHLWTGTKSA